MTEQVYLGSCQISVMELYAETVNCGKVLNMEILKDKKDRSLKVFQIHLWRFRRRRKK